MIVGNITSSVCLKYCQLNGHEKIDEERSEGRSMPRKVDALKLLNDDTTGIFHVFEMRIRMNEFDHRILALLEQQRERPEKFRLERGFEP